MRHQRVESFHLREQGLDRVGQGVDPVDAVEHRPQREADRDVVTVRFPVEVVADRPEEVVEVGDAVPQVLHVANHAAHLHDHVVGDVGHLLGEVLHPLHLIDGGLHIVGLGEHLRRQILVVLLRELLGGALHADQERDRGVLDRGALRAGDGLHPGDALDGEDGLGDLVDDEEVRRVAQVVVALDHQHLGVHPGLGEVPVGRGVPLVGRGVRRQVVAVVVVGPVSGQRQQADQRQCHRPDQDGSRPPDHRRGDLAPTADPHRPFGFQQAEAAGHHHDGAAQRQCRDHHDAHPDRQRHTEGLEVGQPGEAQAERRAGDREPGAEHHVRGALKHGEVGRLPVLAHTSGFLVAADQENRVVRRGRDRQHHQQAGGERRQSDDLVVPQERHHAAGGGQRQHHRRQHQQHGDDRTVEPQQHGDDDHERHHLGDPQALVAGLLLIGDHRGRSGEVHLHPGRRGQAVDVRLDRRDRFVGQRLALVAGGLDLDVDGLAVVALRAGGGQRVAPEVLDRLHVFGVGPQLGDHLVVEGTRGFAQRLLALQHDHRRGVGVALLEDLADALHRDHRRGGVGAHRDRLVLPDHLQLRNGDVQYGDQRDPAHDDRQREGTDDACGQPPLGGVCRAHADFTKQ